MAGSDAQSVPKAKGKSDDGAAYIANRLSDRVGRAKLGARRREALLEIGQVVRQGDIKSFETLTGATEGEGARFTARQPLTHFPEIDIADALMKNPTLYNVGSRMISELLHEAGGIEPPFAPHPEPRLRVEPRPPSDSESTRGAGNVVARQKKHGA